MPVAAAKVIRSMGSKRAGNKADSSKSDRTKSVGSRFDVAQLAFKRVADAPGYTRSSWVDVGAPPDLEWIRARRQLLKRVKQEVARRLGPDPDDVIEYHAHLERELKRRCVVSSKSQLLFAIEKSNIVYGGDFHAFAQAQRTHLKILRSISDERPVLLAMECFPIGAQKWLDRYCSGKISADVLRRRTLWDSEWGFPWEHYLPLLELARRRGFRLIGLNRSVRKKSGSQLSDLREREMAAAEVLENYHRRMPESLIYVIFGDLHLASGHLPKVVRTRVGEKKLRDLVIHLNSEAIYFRLARKGLELDVDVVRLSKNHYCVMSSPPWVKWQSYLLYLDHAVDTELGGGGIEFKDFEEEFEPTDRVVELVRIASQDLRHKMKVDQLSVYAADNERMWRRIERKLLPREKQIIRYLLSSGRTFYLPQSGIGCLGRTTINHASSLAGHYLHARLSLRKRNVWNVPADFPALIWTEAVAFFVSKLINHKRQAETLVDLKAQIALAGPEDQGREAMRLALDQRLSEILFIMQGRRRALRVRPRQRTSYLEAARILGGMLGERLYMAHRSRKLKSAEILQLIRRDTSSRTFDRDYQEIVRKVEMAFRSASVSSVVRGGFPPAEASKKDVLENRAFEGGTFEGVKSKKERL
jgi:hypothetical protein